MAYKTYICSSFHPSMDSSVSELFAFHYTQNPGLKEFDTTLFLWFVAAAFLCIMMRMHPATAAPRRCSARHCHPPPPPSRCTLQLILCCFRSSAACCSSPCRRPTPTHPSRIARRPSTRTLGRALRLPPRGICTARKTLRRRHMRQVCCAPACAPGCF